MKKRAIIVSRDRTEVSALMHSPGGMTEFCETSGHIRDKASHEAAERLQFGIVFLSIIISRLEPKIEESRLMMIDNPKKASTESGMSDHIKSLTWLTDLHLEFCSHRTRNQLYQSINQAAGEIVVITGDLSAGPHRLAQYTELAEQIRKPVYFVLGNHDRYGTTFANAEAVVERVTTLFPHMVRLDGSQVMPLNKSVALVGVDGWADGLGGEGPATRARINDFYQILDFATDPEPQVFREMKERARKYSQALKPSLLKALKQYQTTIIATHVPPYENAAWHEGSPSSPDYQPFFSSPTMGNLIKAAAAEHPGKSALVLCGLTHSPGIYRYGNILVLTAGARYGFPEITKTIHLDQLASIFE